MNKLVRRMLKITLMGILSMGYLIIFVVTYGIAERILPELTLTVLIWTYMVYFIYKWIDSFFEEDPKCKKY